MIKALEINIQGLVQGVGFRPFIYLLAMKHNIYGTIANHNHGVIIQINQDDKNEELFIKDIINQCPKAACITKIEIQEIVMSEGFKHFSIIESQKKEGEITQISPDISVCEECLQDRLTQKHRVSYPFINCTYCGPRFSIIQGLPYDREKTTMTLFTKCDICETEYKNVYDRRFHAQPIACNSCGPIYYADYKGNRITDYFALLDLSSQIINDGGIIALKGIGGYHLVCDATNKIALTRLREIKIRDSKPFAIMGKNIESLEYVAYINGIEKEALISWRRPIVILQQRERIPKEINTGMKTLGCMLPYMPIHYDLFDNISTSILVMTSGNINNLPIVISNEEADTLFTNKVDIILHHNRDIHNRVDDSIVQFLSDKLSIIRRSRGYIPEPFFTTNLVDGILAFGAEKTNTFSFGKSNMIIQSQYIGNINNYDSFNFYKQTLRRFIDLFHFSPSLLVSDLHPDYLSTTLCEEYANIWKTESIKVQHHHAHAVSCMAEHRIFEPVIAIVWDGIGLGDDGEAWGGEFFICDREKYRRLLHFQYIPMPGGDKVSSEPWRMAVAYLHSFGLPIPDSFIKRIGKPKIENVRKIVDKKINCPPTSSAGRLLDALASLLGICDFSSYQAEAPILLEQIADNNYIDHYEIEITDTYISFQKLFESVIKDLLMEIKVQTISAKIHNSLAFLILDVAKKLILETKIKKVVISGGCFQNKRLVEHLQRLFANEKILFYIPYNIPCNDSGISVGQIEIAAALKAQPIK